MFFQGKTKILIIVLSIIILVLAGLLFLNKKETFTPQAPLDIPVFSPSPTSSPLIPTPSASVIPTRVPSINFAPGDANKVLDKLNNRQALTITDQQAKTALIQLANPKTGVIVTTNTFKLEYLPAGDFFMSQILIANIDQSKQETVEWLKGQGLTQQGICDLPFYFYLSPSVSNQLKDTGYQFSRLPEGC